MEAISDTTTEYKQVTVEVPEERLAEFHAVFARFLAGRDRRGRRGEHRRHGHGRGHACGYRHERAARSEAYEGSIETPGQTPQTTEA
ncbi:MAG TPA: hypothetical protein VMD09_10155 [Solirubrobacteraceae bacterium]|nr:hypothetical protein [Solirubrobacteraceae bacterium]